GDAISNQTCANRFTVTRTYRATDECGNSATCTQTITVFDNTPPTLTCPTNVTVQCASLIPPVNTNLVAADNCTGAAPIVTFVSDVNSNQTCANRFIVTRTYRATDACGNSATCAQTITVFDNTPPVITCPTNTTVQCASDVPVPNLNLVATDNCGGTPPVITVASNITTNQTCANRFTLNRTYRATDACGNSATCVQVITVFDNTPPVITFTDPLLLGLPNNGTLQIQCFGQDPNWNPPTFSQASVSVTDNCAGTVTTSYNEVFVNGGNCTADGYINKYKLTWTATDVCGNSSSRVAFIELIDTIPPVILGVPANITVNCDQIPDPPQNITTTDECLCACIVTYQQSTPLPGCQNGQVITRTWTAKDDCGNVTVETQTITLKDSQGPVLQITTPQLAGLPNGSVLDYTCNEGGIPAFFDNLGTQSVIALPSCGGTATIKFASTNFETRNCSFFGFMEQSVYTWTATDACGNVTTFTITAQLVDNEPPVLIGVPAMACQGDPALNDIEAIDNCDQGTFTYFDKEIPNPCGTGKAISRLYHAFDQCGNVTEATAILIPNDNNGPVMTFTDPDLAGLDPGEILVVECSADFSVSDVSADESCPGTVITFDDRVSVNSNCSASGVIASHQLTWTATDMCGNSSELSVQVIVVDHTPPVFSNQDAEITIGCNDPIPVNVATDNCGSVVMTVNDAIIPGNCSYEYDIHRQVTATDPCGNSTTLVQTIHVGNGSGPIISGVEEVVCNDLSISDVTAWDPCAGQSVPVTMTDKQLDVPCHDGVVIERTWTATDICGHTSQVTQTFILDDHTPPEIQIPSYSIILKYLDNPGNNNLVFLSQTDIMEQLNALDEGSISFFDDCGAEIKPVFTLDVSYSGNCAADGYFERRTYTWIASDACGNEAIVSFTIDIMDDIPPVFSGVPADAVIICEPLPSVPIVKANDPAQPVSIVYSEVIVNGNAAGEFVVTRTWIATDACGNSSSAVQVISWIPNTLLECGILLPASVDCNSHDVVITSSVSGGLGALTYSWEVVGEECFIESGQGTPEISIYIGFTAVTIILTVADEFGCSTICSAELDCVDPFLNPLTGLPIKIDPAQRNDDIPQVTESNARRNMDKVQQLNLWPNPANESVTLNFESLIEQPMHYTLTNFLGQVMLSDQLNARIGFNTRKLDVAALPQGSYLLELKSETEIHTKVVVLLRD
ncbi:MAG: T9SS type A sorting domain-containing protein, partial [Saprospiraceae bacterium]